MRITLLVSCYLLLGACSPLYVMRAVYEHSKILWSREEIVEAINDPQTSALEAQKLRLVLQARTYATTIGLDPKDSFTKFARLDRSELAWVVVGSRPTSFELYRWWFPIVGSVPYKGFYDLKDAERSGEILESIGYETWIRPTDAISTLGYFNDPVLSTTLQHSEPSIANTVIHESVHSTIWIPDHVDFNESLANFVGTQAAIGFFEQLLQNCKVDTCRVERNAQVEEARQAKLSSMNLAAILSELYDKLGRLYASTKSHEQKMHERMEIFETHISPIREKNPKLSIFKKINNAEIMQFRLYMTNLQDFEALFNNGNHNWDLFFAGIKRIKDGLQTGTYKTPWEGLRAVINSSEHSDHEKRSLL
ncbi:MAG: aminopeptidase [Bdellovibrionales bacterium]|nr:aminopeptidase [Bdellovibrionales bacterium]